MTTSEWVTVDEAAEILDLTRNQVYRRIESNRLSGSSRQNINGRQRLLIPAVSVKAYQAGDTGPADGSPDLLRAPAVADMLGCSVERVRRLVKDGSLPAVFGGVGTRHETIRVSRAAVENFLSAK